MAAIESFARRHPALTYYALVFVISWGGILLLVGPGGIPGRPEQVATMMPIALVALFAGPSVAGLVCTALVHGRAGLRDLFDRGLRWRVGVRAYAAALLPAPLLVAGRALRALVDLSRVPPRNRHRPRQGRIAAVRARVGARRRGPPGRAGLDGIRGPDAEAATWPHSRPALIVGFLWGVWHYLIAFWASGTSTGALSPTLFLPGMVFYVASLPAYRVLMVWLYDRTESLPLAMLMHASFSASMLILQPPSIGLRAGLTWNLVLAAVLWTAVGAVALAGHGHLSRPALRRQSLQGASS